MKLPAARVEGFLRRPAPEIRAVLLYGPDAGLVRERADTIARTACPELHDPFRVAEFTGAALTADPARLFDEASQISLTGGKRVIRVRDATDSVAPLMSRFLAAPSGDALVVLESGDLPGRSALRRAFDDTASGAAIGCYPDAARDLAGVIRESLAAHRVTASRDATDFLVEHLGNDRLVTRSELEKLALYAGDGGRIELDDAHAAIADAATLALDDVVHAAVDGEVAVLDRALTRVFQEGEAPVSVVRATQRHLQRLHMLAARIAGGSSPDDVIRGARPPIFFKQQERFRRQLRAWRASALRRQLDALCDAEARMKTTGLPPETICRAALTSVALVAKSADQ